MKTRSLSIAWNLIVVIVSLVYISRFSKYPSASRLFPELVGYTVLALGLASFFVEIVRFRLRSQATPTNQGRDLISVGDGLLALFFAVLYLALWQFLGFVLDTIMLMIVAPLLLGYPWRSISWLLGLGVAAAAIFAFLFHLGAGAILPRGIFNVGWV